MAFLNERNLVRELFLRGWIRAGWKRQRQGGRDATNKEKKGGRETFECADVLHKLVHGQSRRALTRGGSEIEASI